MTRIQDRLNATARWRVDVRVQAVDVERCKQHAGPWISAVRFDVPQAITDAPKEAQLEIAGVLATSSEIAERFASRLFTRVGVSVLAVRARRTSNR